uniref:Uncharacterized protein n=1 Tax=Neogobius melanostomus TaxID=47308 RepID=A0A8C6SQ17_9GOBI
ILICYCPLIPRDERHKGHQETHAVQPGKWGRAWEVDWFSLMGVIALLCFAPFIVWESNPGPSSCEARALTAALPSRI